MHAGISAMLPPWMLHSQLYSLVVIGLDGRYLFVNECFRKRFSFMADDFTGLPVEGTVHPDDLPACAEASAFCVENPGVPRRLMIRKPDPEPGVFHWTEWEFSLLQDEEKKPVGILCIGHDVSETVRTKEENEVTIRDQHDKLKEIAWQQSHELRSPVVNILGCINLITDKKKLITEEEAGELYGVIKKELSQLDEVIHKIVKTSHQRR
jgi:PAS domain S-box-containing protein